MNKYGFSITFGLNNHDQRLSCDLGGAIGIGSSIGGGHEINGADVWFSLLFALMQFKVFLVNAITIMSCSM